MPSSGPRGAPFPRHGPARARRPDPAGTGPPLRAPWRRRTSVYGFGDRRAAAVPMARSLFPLFGFQPCHAGRVRGGMAWYASPDGRPTERVPPACPIDSGHPAGPGPSYRLVSDAIVRSLPESSPLIGWIASCLRPESNQHPRCFRPLLYRLIYRGAVRRTVMGSGL